MENDTPNVSRGLSGVLRDEDAAIRRGYTFWHNSNWHRDRKTTERSHYLDARALMDSKSKPVESRVRPVLLPTTMHGTRPSVAISCSRKIPFPLLREPRGGLMNRLVEKMVNYLRRFGE